MSVPVLSVRPAKDDLEHTVALSTRMVRRYLEAFAATYPEEKLLQQAASGEIPKPIRLALRLVEMQARSKDAQATANAMLQLHTYLPPTALSRAPAHLVRDVRVIPTDQEFDVTKDHADAEPAPNTQRPPYTPPPATYSATHPAPDPLAPPDPSDYS